MKQLMLILVVCGMMSFACAAIPTTGLQLHLDADSLTGYANGDAVLTWPDLAGGNNNATSTGTPTYVANGLNGLPVISIDGTSGTDGYGLPNSDDFYSIPTISNVKTIAFVFKPTSNTYYTWATMMSGPTSENYGWHGDTHWGTTYWDYAYTIDSIANSDLVVDGVNHINGGWTAVDYDNFHVITIQLASGTPFDLGFLAHTARYNATNVYGMEIAELLVYTQQLSATELEELQFELGHKYGLWSAKPVSPADGAATVPINQDLSWQSYDASWAVDVYLDPNETNVAAGNASAKIVSNQVLSTFDPGVLDFNTTYYWRVDLYEPNTVGYIFNEGPVWSFTTVPPDPLITVNPVSQTVDTGDMVELSVAGENIESYQWYLNDVAVEDAMNATLRISSLAIDDEGVYTCVASNTVGSVTSAPAVVVSKRLMGWWKLDGDLTDSVVSEVSGAIAHNGSISDPNFVIAGKDGGAYEFMGDGRTIVIANSNDYFNFYPSGLTVSAWIKTTQAGWGGFVGKIESSTSGFYLTHNGKLSAGGMRGVGQVQYDTQIDDVWQLITMTWDASIQTMSLYVDGKLQSQTVYATVPPVGSLSLYFGAENLEGTAFPYVGLLDDVKIWSYPLDTLTIAHLYTDLTEGGQVCLNNPAFDLSGPEGQPDCQVDFYDFAAMAAQWLECNIVPDCIN